MSKTVHRPLVGCWDRAVGGLTRLSGKPECPTRHKTNTLILGNQTPQHTLLASDVERAAITAMYRPHVIKYQPEGPVVSDGAPQCRTHVAKLTPQPRASSMPTWRQGAQARSGAMRLGRWCNGGTLCHSALILGPNVRVSTLATIPTTSWLHSALLTHGGITGGNQSIAAARDRHIHR